jgi:leucyl/phenylalanyl-tRNA--protein transferase
MDIPESYYFPPVSFANDEGILAVGGDLSPGRLIHAYRSGIFPMFETGEPILWWSPDPRFVLFPQHLQVSHSMQQLFRKGLFRYRFNTRFREVITLCSKVNRKEQVSTWITDDMIEAYCQLNEMGKAFSAEAWQDGKLVGGCYGVWLGEVFFGESMFSLMPNASKFAFIQLLKQEGRLLKLVDCQMETAHLQSLGAGFISRDDFIEMLNVHALREPLIAFK